MKIHTYTFAFLIIVLTTLLTLPVISEENTTINLPAPQTEGGMSLMQALKLRHSSRSYSSKELPIQMLSDMLWAARGINRPDSGKLTSPTAVNWQEIDVYVSMAKGLYLYNATDNTLELVLAEDIRAQTGMQPFVKDAPVNLIYVADFTKMKTDEDKKVFYSATDTGYVSQNVYLYCAVNGLATVVRGLVDKPALKEIMPLRSDQHVILTQSVGYPDTEE